MIIKALGKEYNIKESNYVQLCDKLTDIMIKETL